MAKYIVPLFAAIEVEAPNVVKAKRAAEGCKVFSRTKKDFWCVWVDVKSVKVGTPVKCVAPSTGADK